MGRTNRKANFGAIAASNVAMKILVLLMDGWRCRMLRWNMEIIKEIFECPARAAGNGLPAT
jgi:hypothetical protein